MEAIINQNPAKKCPACGGELSSEAPQGLCPKCLLAGAAAPTESGVTGAGAGAAPRAPALEAVAAAFPQLEVIELIGVGGMGAVFKARQKHLERFVALKVMSEALAANPAFVERFNREARVLAKLNHPNIVTLHDFGQAGPFCYLLMEYIDGVNLRQAMRAGRMTAPEALALVPKICDALQFAHDEGVLHRDIKPENILLDSRGRVKIADFGVAKLLGSLPDPMTLTASGAAMGTPNYMAPEQIETPTHVDHRADIYSLGVVLYEMLTGELPLGRFPAPSARTPVDQRVDGIVLRALEKERELRQQSAHEMRTQVEGVTRESGAPAAPTPAPPRVGAAPAGVGLSPGWNAKSVAGVLFTGLSVLGALVAVFLFRFLYVDLSRTGGSPSVRLLILAVAGLLAITTLGIAGWVLGWLGLRESTRRREGGLGRALAWVAITGWPVAIVAITGFLVPLRQVTSMESGAVERGGLHVQPGISGGEAAGEPSEKVEAAGETQTVPDLADQQKARVRLELTEKKLTEARLRMQNGHASEDEVRGLERDVEVFRAQLAGDRVAAAQAQVSFAEWAVSNLRKRLEVGVVPPSAVAEAEAELTLRRIDLEQALHGVRQKPSPGTESKR